MKEYLCIKDWLLNGQLIYKAGVSYKGKSKKTKYGTQVEIKNPKGVNISFHTGSEYFLID